MHVNAAYINPTIHIVTIQMTLNDLIKNECDQIKVTLMYRVTYNHGENNSIFPASLCT